VRIARALRPIRPRPPRPPQEAVQMQLWLVFGAIAIVVVLYTAWQGFQKSNPPPVVEGAKANQQQIADAARTALAKDSTNVTARLALANVLYDTANWADAIVQYKAAARLDSTRAETYVDEGVCYYNLSLSAPAEALFHKALELDPHQPVALFNLGIVTETRGDAKKALEYYHQAMQASPPEGMKQPLMEAMQRVMQKTGQKAPPIPGLDAGDGQPK
jgi:tetratricopeptide (TPR) repeat protein